jgi:MFS family permease
VLHHRFKCYYGYVVVTAVWIGYFTTFGLLIYGASVANTAMVRQNGFDTASIGIATAVSTFLQGALGPLAGALNHKRGIRLSMAGGSAVLILGCLLMYFAVKNELSYILVFGVVMGIGLAFAGTITVQTAVNNWFEKRKAFAMGIVMASTAVGGTVAPLVARSMTDRLGWQSNWLMMAAFCGVVSVMSAMLLVNKPCDIGQEIDGEKKESTNSGQPEEKLKSTVKFRDVIKTKLFFILMMGFAVRSMVFYCLTGYVLLLMYSKDVSVATASVVLPIFSAASFFGKLLGGVRLPRRIKPQHAIGFNMTVMAIGVILLSSFPQIQVLRLSSSVLFGLGLGAITVQLPVAVSHIYGTDNFAVLIGWLGPANSMLASVGPLVLGIVAKVVGYTLPFLVLGCLVLIVAALFFSLESDRKQLADLG